MVVSTTGSAWVKAVVSKAGVVSTVCSEVVKVLKSTFVVVSATGSAWAKSVVSKAGVVSTVCSVEVVVKAFISTFSVVLLAWYSL